MAKSYRSEMCDKLIYQLITASSMMKKCTAWRSTNTITGLYPPVWLVSFNQTTFLGHQNFLAHTIILYYWHHHHQASWQLCVQLPKLAANRVRASLPDKVHHPKQSTFPKRTFEEAQFLTMRIALLCRSGTYGQCKLMPSLVLRVLSEAFAIASKHHS